MVLQIWIGITVLSTLVIQGSCQLSVCDATSDFISDTCALLSKDLEKSLLQDEGNLFRMRKAFFHSPTAFPVLLKVVYNVTFTGNISKVSASGIVPRCFISTVDSAIDLNQRNITYGWTSSGVYTVFHPMVLMMMTAHTPFAVLRVIQRTLGQRGPETDTFLWDGSYDLPTLHLNLYINSLSCIPSNDLLEAVLMELNVLLKVYTRRQETQSFIQRSADVGFTLPSTSVSTFINPSGSDVTIVILYSFTLCLLYSMSVCLFPFWCYCPTEDRKQHTTKIKEIILNNKELFGGLLITGILAIFFEILTRSVHLFVWSVQEGNGLGNFKALWLPQLVIGFCVTCVTIVGHIIVCGKKLLTRYLDIAVIPEGFSQYKGCVDHTHNTRFESCFDYALRFSTSKMHIILVLHLTTFGVLYCFFPAIILTFVYPTRMIAIFTFVLAYFFATTIAFAIMIKSYGLFFPHTNKIRTKKLTFCVLLLMVIVFLMFIYTTFLVFLYILIVGRGSIVNTGPLFIISLFPSIILSLGAWIAERVVLKGSQNIRFSSYMSA